MSHITTRLGLFTAKVVFDSGSEGAPAEATSGVNLNGVGGLSIVAACDAGQSFSSAAGLFHSFYFDPLIGLWVETQDLDLQLNAEQIGQRFAAFLGFTVANPRGRICHSPVGVNVTGGQITLYYLCTGLRGLRDTPEAAPS